MPNPGWMMAASSHMAFSTGKKGAPSEGDRAAAGWPSARNLNDPASISLPLHENERRLDVEDERLRVWRTQRACGQSRTVIHFKYGCISRRGRAERHQPGMSEPGNPEGRNFARHEDFLHGWEADR